MKKQLTKMKKQLTLFTFVALLFAGCTIDTTTDNFVGSDGVTTITVTTPATRTSLGEKEGDTYPVYWSEGDQIVVNGRRSSEVVIDSSNRSCAVWVTAALRLRER